MNAIVFDPKKHLTSSDQERLAVMAREAGMEVADFIEVVLKKALFATILANPETEKAA